MTPDLHKHMSSIYKYVYALQFDELVFFKEVHIHYWMGQDSA